MGGIHLDISVKAGGAWGIQEWAIIIGGATAIATAIIALCQYVSANRSQARAHMHSLFRDYLTVRMNDQSRKEEEILGYRYYAMEEAYYWLIKEHARWKLLFLMRMGEDEYRSWLNTINHHVDAEKDSVAYKYFDDNQLLFGVEFRKHVCGRLGLAVKYRPDAGPPAAAHAEDAGKKEAAAEAGQDAPPSGQPQAPGPS